MATSKYFSYAWPGENPVLVVLETWDVAPEENILRCQLLTFPVGGKVNEVYKSRGRARKSPVDVYNERIGVRTARNRALRHALEFWEECGDVQQGTWDRLFYAKKKHVRTYFVSITGPVYIVTEKFDHIPQPRWGKEISRYMPHLISHAIHEGATVEALKRFRTYVSLHREEGEEWFITTVKCQADQYGEPDDFEENTFPVETEEAPDVFADTYLHL